MVDLWFLIAVCKKSLSNKSLSTVLHRCFFPHKKLQSVLNYTDLPLSISYYRLLCKTKTKKKNANVHVAENVKQRPLGSHFSVGLSIRCNAGKALLLHREVILVTLTE